MRDATQHPHRGTTKPPTFDPTKCVGWSILTPELQQKTIEELARMVPLAQLEYWRRRSIRYQILAAAGDAGRGPD
jgi:hypothetical protein